MQKKIKSISSMKTETIFFGLGVVMILVGTELSNIISGLGALFLGISWLLFD